MANPFLRNDNTWDVFLTEGASLPTAKVLLISFSILKYVIDILGGCIGF